jgi:hypothetical protein
MSGDIGDSVSSDPASGMKSDWPEDFDGLLQLSSALTPPPYLGDAQGSHDTSFDILTTKHVRDFYKELQKHFVPHDAPFALEPCYSAEGEPPHTWLGSMSRHAALKLAPSFHDPEIHVPELLNWCEHDAHGAKWESFLRVQRTSRRQGSKDHSEPLCDCNDYLLSETCSQDPHAAAREHQLLLDLRRFLAELYAQRRSRIFAGHLSERIYNIWLTPGLIRPTDRVGSGFVILPFVTLVRRPFRVELRRTIALSVVFVPVKITHEESLSTRKMAQHEISQFVRSLAGASTHVPEHADQQFELVNGPLKSYIDELATQCRWPVTKNLAKLARGEIAQDTVPTRTSMESKTIRPHGTIRQWVELFFTATAEPVFLSIEKAVRPNAARHKRTLSDEILRAIRLSTAWSMLVMSDDFTPFDGEQPRIVDGVWWPLRHAHTSGAERVDDGVPPAVSQVLTSLVAENALPVTKGDRVDDMQCGLRGALIWRIAHLQCVVTVYRAKSNYFPDVSALYLFGWMSHALVGVTSVRAIVGALARESERSRDRDVAELAKRSHRLTLEMEEMFDLNVAWPEYGRLYTRIREGLGVEDVYRRARERLEQLSQYAEVVMRTDQEKRIETLQWIAGFLATGIIGVGVVQVLAGRHDHLAAIATAGAAVLLALVFSLYRSFRRSGPT